MTKQRNTNTILPAGLALLETAGGRWFPAFAPRSETPHLVALVDPPSIPAAREPVDDPKDGYQCREEAINACYAWQEAALLPIHWATLAARTEVYPERTAWYLEEIGRLTAEARLLWSYGTDVFGVVLAECDGRQEVVTASAATPDEAIEALYQRVYAWSCQQACLSQRAS